MVVFIDRDANVNNGLPFGWLESYVLILWRKMDMTDAYQWSWTKTGA